MIADNANCYGCGLNKSSAISIYGRGAKGLLILFDSQTPIMAASKSYGIGFEIDFIKRHLYQYGVVLEDDCWVASAIQCYTDKPTEKHLDCCRPSVDALVKTLKPKAVLAVGELAARAVFHGTIKGSIALERVHGFIHNWRKHHCHAIAAYLPGQYGRRSEIVNAIVKRDIHLAVKALQMPVIAWQDELTCVRHCDGKEAVKRLQSAIADDRERWEAFDYETTGLRPYNAGQELVSCAICTGVDESYAFMLDEEVLPWLRKWLNAPQIKKIAHNLSFELMWSAEKVGTWGRSMKMDTMILAHALDNRDTKITSIKFLAPMLLGCPAWNDSVEPYLKSDPKQEEKLGNNAINNIRRVPRRELLTYNAIDSLVEFRAAGVMIGLLCDFRNTLPTNEAILAMSKGWKP